jgi:Lon protease-like protein
MGVVESLPLFPLGMVLFPGVLLPLHIFEERYRELVRALLAGDAENQWFGVVAIRQGWEVGEDAVSALHDIGCAAELRRVSRYPDGRYDIVTVGTDRFRLRSVDRESRPYLVGSVDWLPAEPRAADLAGLAAAVGALFGDYADAAAGLQGRPAEPTEPAEPAELPAEPVELAYAVAAGAVLTLEDRQALLAAETTRARLQAELRLLKRETTMVRRLRALPVPIAELQVTQSLS